MTLQPQRTFATACVPPPPRRANEVVLLRPRVVFLTLICSQVKSVVMVKADEALRKKVAEERYAAAPFPACLVVLRFAALYLLLLLHCISRIRQQETEFIDETTGIIKKTHHFCHFCWELVPAAAGVTGHHDYRTCPKRGVVMDCRMYPSR